MRFFFRLRPCAVMPRLHRPQTPSFFLAGALSFRTFFSSFWFPQGVDMVTLFGVSNSTAARRYNTQDQNRVFGCVFISSDGSLSPLPCRCARKRSTTLSEKQRDWIASSDTFTLGTYADGEYGGADASNRGGNPGFVRALDDRTIVFPDYKVWKPRVGGLVGVTLFFSEASAASLNKSISPTG